MNIMTKRGNLDNVVTYEHICDTTADMNNIDPQYITLGSICIVINNEDSGMEVYMANSNKEWNSIAMGAGSSDGGSGASSLMNLLDVEVLNPTDGQTLTYDATAQKWINGGGNDFIVTLTSTYDEQTDETTYAVDKTNQEIYEAAASGKNVRMIFDDQGDFFFYKLDTAFLYRAIFSSMGDVASAGVGTILVPSTIVNINTNDDIQSIFVYSAVWEATLDD